MNYPDSVVLDSSIQMVLAVSGGADSMYMAMRFSELYGAEKAIALIVDHGIRQGSGDEAKWVMDYLKEKGFKAEILSLNMDADLESGIQETARKLRYQALLKYCEEYQIYDLSFAHNLDDQLETIFMNLERGSGLDGAAGIAPQKRYGNVTIHRPILDTSRDVIESELKEKNWEWVEDPSNQNENFKRVRIRKFLREFEDYATLRKRSGLFVKNLRQAQDFIEHELLSANDKIVRYDDLCYAEIDCKAFWNLHPELQNRLFIKVLQSVSGNVLKPRLQKLEVMLDRIENAAKNDEDTWTFGGCLIIYKQGLLYIIRELNAIEEGEDRILGFDCYDNRFKMLKGNGAIAPLGLEGYSWLRGEIELPKKVSNMVYQVLPTIRDENGQIVAVYGLYGNWEDYLMAILF